MITWQDPFIYPPHVAWTCWEKKYQPILFYWVQRLHMFYGAPFWAIAQQIWSNTSLQAQSAGSGKFILTQR